MVRRNSARRVLGVVHRVGEQLAHMVVLQPVEHLCALAPGAYQPGHPQLREVLRHRRPRLVDPLGEVVDRELTIGQRPQQLNARRIGQHPEHLDDQVGVIVGKRQTT